ncbi:RNA-directed DNA polymerase-like protein [Cucumis melo var. makuwa]|uniref:RNA-directed DNA polymerase-like protein n=1 Tax=Cucumis melo var. makuwa TaxID=1194695 RepID=A0A5A7SUC6_CUCMM|nr:RNA-directed DNA polymerase-like protein [Cucumis melo var. makuwa]TYJ98790.1 RNA-directed DNA polymerase-like protein [Cucumis melo var. makuwa]
MAISLVDEQIELKSVPTEIQKVLNEYVDIVLHELPKTLPPQWGIDHEIELVPRTKSLAKNAYQMPPLELIELRKQLDELLAAGFIKPAKAPYEARVLFQRNNDRTLRLCIDYRALKKFKLDLRSGYYQVRIAQGDEPKTTCVYKVFHEYLDQFVVAYLNDIVVFSSSLEKYQAHLRILKKGCTIDRVVEERYDLKMNSTSNSSTREDPVIKLLMLSVVKASIGPVYASPHAFE